MTRSYIRSLEIIQFLNVKLTLMLYTIQVRIGNIVVTMCKFSKVVVMVIIINYIRKVTKSRYDNEDADNVYRIWNSIQP